MPGDWLEAAENLRRSRTPFVLATVVAREAPQSARVGAHALIHADGRIEGWIGGGCVRPTMVREAKAALADGRPRLVRMSPGAPPDGREDVRVYPLTCQGEGAVDVYLEPVLPAPVLVVLGATPVARALLELAPWIGLDAELHEVTDLPASDTGVAELVARLSASAPSAALRYVVVATMGEGDEEALEAAARAGADYIGLVSGRKKAESLFAYLRSRGLPPDVEKSIKAPAGLDLGSATPGEIALSILAELVQHRRGAAQSADARDAKSPGKPAAPDELFSPSPSPSPNPPLQLKPRSPAPLPILGAQKTAKPGPGDPPASRAASSEKTAVDPVCGMTVDVSSARHTTTLPDGRAYYFCCPHCRAAFEREPDRYLSPVL